MLKFRPKVEGLEDRWTPDATVPDVPGVDPTTGGAIVTPTEGFGELHHNFPPATASVELSVQYNGAQGFVIAELWDVTAGQPEVQVGGTVIEATGSGTAWWTVSGLQAGHTYRVAYILQGTSAAVAKDIFYNPTGAIAPPPAPVELPPPPYVP